MVGRLRADDIISKMKIGIEGFERDILPLEGAIADGLLSHLAIVGSQLLSGAEAWYVPEPWPVTRRKRIVLSETELRNLYEGAGNLRGAAFLGGVSPEVIRREMVDKGLPRKSPGRPAACTPEEVLLLADIYQGGFSLQEVAEISGGMACDGPHLGKLFRKHGVKIRPRGRRLA